MIQKVRRDTLSEQVTQGILTFIDEQDMVAGDALPSEARLAEEFGVSRPIIREALKTLQGEGVIEIVTGKNAVIKPVSSVLLRKFFERAIAFKSASFKDLIEVRRGLEIQSVILASQRCTDDDLEALALSLNAMRDNLNNQPTFAEHDIDFHLRIASASGNPMMFYLIESIREAMRDTILQGLKHRLKQEEFQQVQQCHEAIFDALKNHDAEQAQLAMQAHFDEALTGLMNHDDT